MPLPRLLALLVAIVATLGVTIAIVDSDEDARPEKITVTLGGPGRAQVTVPVTELDEHADEPHHGARTQPAVPRAVRAATQRAAKRTTTGSDDVPQQATLAAPSQRGCTTKLVRNFSGRRGARPALLVAHYTVSPNRPGWGDVNGIVSYFDQARSQASSTYVIDNEGHCAFIVSELNKPWTQGYFNPWSISIEFINSGREATLAGTAGLAKGAQVFADAGKRWGIPMRRAIVDGCRIVRSGIIDHNALDCGNSHHDVSPYALQPLIDAAAAAAAPRITATDRATCAKLNAWRNAGRPPGQPDADAVRRRKALEARGVTCTRTGPVRA